ncbi:LOG family protein YgdH [bacterium BMS3Abin07]|nr:LOG family protein YgdH [bacterium BMS3Abin07]GBE31115.1 LOG family protein YgdH [bacterium BMS3Bbin05]HDL20987.1 TIGR00730 family Rossman fold protein [Nitrospirota bacterium]HDO22884.1 TIGR00730 family Rossman fold protein [Nitrospirota bacterium]HDZ87214.1 TIGR00730 family Rossman fold protein [Nitrospirota bacterium]
MNIYFTRTNGPVDDAIDDLVKLVGDVNHPEIVREMILAALKAGKEHAGREDLRLMNYTMKEMRYTSKVFGPYRHVKKVTVFGSARTGPDEPVYDIARQLGRKLAEAGYMVITGGGGGIMQAVNEGAGPERSFGVNIQLPFEQKPNPVLTGNPRLITYKYFFNRKVAFVKEAHAITLFPGGFGTLDEAMETLTLLQTGKHNPLPLILIDEPGGTYWSRWERFFREELLAEGYISGSDFNLFELVDSVDDAIERINHFYRLYHSIRHVGKKLVIRLSSGIDEEQVRQLKERFSDMLIPGGDMYISGPLPDESDEPDILDLPRLVVDFDRRHFSRLRKFIHEINKC